MQLAEIEARTIIEAENPQLIFQLFWLLIDQSIHKILHSDWLNLDGRDSPLLLHDVTSVITKQRD